ncbi:conserved exported hypothetical protein [Candidatus Sulfopaludibacter sp. SbA4]|nr:conserved exported hypothetical protein [Candidatus Sulfopaludibacter sp. SbA4]
MRMAARFLALFILPVLLLMGAAKKTVATAKGENEDLILTVTLYIDPTDVKQAVGSDLDGHYIMADVKVDPKYGKDITIDRDDFVLRSNDTGEKTTPFAASQIAGRGALIIAQSEEKKKKHGWSMGGPVMIGSGSGAGEDDKDKPAPKMVNGEEENPLKKVLEGKILPEKKTDQATSGLLFFPMEKQKLKDLELRFGGQENRISLRFKP